MIGVGTPIGVVNDCNVGPDGVDDASVPKSFWAKIQVIEYLRSFMLGRMFAQRYRGLQIVSGAFGVYKKWIVEAVKGYTTGSLAEDMDIDAKIWRYIDTNNLKYRIRYIPEAFCWSEVPDTFKSLASQRDRWARGMTETIWKNKDLFFNPKFKMLGLFSFPYYVFFEWLTPFIEVIGLLFFVVGVAVGWFPFFILEYILLIYWVIGILMNIVALSVEAFTRGHYKNRGTLLRLSFFALLEPLFYHWVNSFIYVIGNLRLLFFRKKGWGQMERVGLKKVPVEGEIVIEPAEPPSMWSRVAAILLVLLIASGALWFFGVYQPSRKGNVSGTPGAAPAAGLQDNTDNEVTNPTLAEREVAVADSMATRLIAADSTSVMEKPEEKTEPEPVVAEPEAGRDGTNELDIVTGETGRYYVIITSARNQDNLFTYARKLQSSGVTVRIIPPFGTRTFTYLSVDDFATLSEASEKIAEYRARYGDQTWVLKY